VFRILKNSLLAGLSVIAIALAQNVLASDSICYGTPAKGKLVNAVELPPSGKNFSSYSSLGNQLGRTYVHSAVRDIVTKAYSQLETSAPDKVFIYGETGFKQGGAFKPHRSHQSGTSVDFMVPVLNERGKSVPLPGNALNQFGYQIEFDQHGKFQNLTIDFEAVAEHLYQLNLAAIESGKSLSQVIFDKPYLPMLFASKRGAYLKSNLQFMQKTPWIRHDEHYHVDFKIGCEPL
jgi:penicillin-insensitive murein DD-endopeptidase